MKTSRRTALGASTRLQPLPGLAPSALRTAALGLPLALIGFAAFAAEAARAHDGGLELPPAPLHLGTDCGEPQSRFILTLPKPDDVASPPDLPTVRLRGRTVDAIELARTIRRVADKTRRKLDGSPGTTGDPSGLVVLLHADRRTPWQHVQYLIDLFAQPTIQIYKLQFAVRWRPPPSPATPPFPGDVR